MFDKHQNTHASGARTLSEGQLLDEISWFEARLDAIGGNGDCAYEKALARSYEQAVSNHRERLASLWRVNNQGSSEPVHLSHSRLSGRV